MVAGKDVCLRRLSKGSLALVVRFNRFLGNDKVTVERIIEGWSESTVAAITGHQVLAVQDTSEIHFSCAAIFEADAFSARHSSWGVGHIALSLSCAIIADHAGALSYLCEVHQLDVIPIESGLRVWGQSQQMSYRLSYQPVPFSHGEGPRYPWRSAATDQRM
jgi:hypothetical protein